MNNMRENQPPLLVKQAHTTSTLPTSTSLVVFLVLLLAITIVISVFWIENRSKHNVAQVQVDKAKERAENAQSLQPLDANARSQNFHFQGKLLLPSTPVPESTKAGALAVTNVPRGRSAGLLSRYGETHQQ